MSLIIKAARKLLGGKTQNKKPMKKLTAAQKAKVKANLTKVAGAYVKAQPPAKGSKAPPTKTPPSKSQPSSWDDQVDLKLFKTSKRNVAIGGGILLAGTIAVIAKKRRKRS
jgi:hypothetical protein